MNLFPNPNNGSFNIVLNEDESEFNIRVFDVLGKEVYNENVDNYITNSMKNIDINLIQGTYIVNVVTESNSVKIPIIIE